MEVIYEKEICKYYINYQYSLNRLTQGLWKKRIG